MVVAELQEILAGVPPGLCFASLLYAGALCHEQLAAQATPAWSLGIAVLVAVVTVLLHPVEPLLIEPYYIWTEYNFIGAAEWVFLVAVPNVVGVVLAQIFVVLAGIVLATPVLIFIGDSDGNDAHTDPGRNSYNSRSSTRSSSRSSSGSSSSVSKNDGVKYNNKGELVEDE